MAQWATSKKPIENSYGGGGLSLVGPVGVTVVGLVARRQLCMDLDVCMLAMDQIYARDTTIWPTVDHQVGSVAFGVAQVDALEWRPLLGVVHHDTDVDVCAHCNVDAWTATTIRVF